MDRTEGANLDGSKSGPPAVAAWAVHAFTATGVVIALMSLLAVERGDFLGALLWLMLGLAVDGVDGSLALPPWAGTQLPSFSALATDFFFTDRD